MCLITPARNSKIETVVPSSSPSVYKLRRSGLTLCLIVNSILALVIASWSKILMLLSSEAVRAFMFSSIVAISAPVPSFFFEEDEEEVEREDCVRDNSSRDLGLRKRSRLLSRIEESTLFSLLCL